MFHYNICICFLVFVCFDNLSFGFNMITVLFYSDMYKTSYRLFICSLRVSAKLHRFDSSTSSCVNPNRVNTTNRVARSESDKTVLLSVQSNTEDERTVCCWKHVSINTTVGIFKKKSNIWNLKRQNETVEKRFVFMYIATTQLLSSSISWFIFHTTVLSNLYNMHF